MCQTILKLKDVAVVIGNETIFNDLSFELKNNDHLAIIGDSGTGKSTLLRTIAGKQPAIDGTIERPFYKRYKETNVIQDPTFSLNHLIAYMDVRHDFRNLQNQQDFFYQQRYNASFAEDAPTVKTYLAQKALSATCSGPWDLPQTIALLHLEPLLDKHLIKLSNGESRRLRIGAALLKNPKLILLDQPLSGVDVKSRQQFNNIFTTIANSGINLIMVCDATEMPSVITTVAVMKKGASPQFIERKNFSPDNFKHTNYPLVNEQLLKPLISHRPLFNIIAKLRNASVSYGSGKVLDNVNWTIKQGEKWALSGPNGSGKSTLLSLICGDHPQAYANDIILFDRQRGSGESIWDIKRNIGFMSPELFQFFPADQNCRHIIQSGFYDTMGVFRKVTGQQEKIVDDWIKLLNLTDYQNKPLRQLPVSMQRLCLLARAMVKNPVLLILDEPCQGFDTAQQSYFKEIIDALSEGSNITWIYVTHHQEQLPNSVTHHLQLTENGKIC
ncbi:ATP-binding cassette domain-containing protein [Geofilum sp. OHC36d9]|uniref:ATP-binding cassette domain-containing protein n=1 Tax=Geofilum sp. OHC36d9 TaxID=3458413 RepID=UPI004034B570